MEQRIICDLIDFSKQKYNVFFILLMVYIIEVEILFGYFHSSLDFLFSNNPLASFLLTFLTPSHLKLIEIWLKFNVTFILSYFFYYSVIDKPKDLRSFIIIKRNFQIYPLIFIYSLFFLMFYYTILIASTSLSINSDKIAFLQAFAVISVFLELFVYLVIHRINKKWVIQTPREKSVFDNGGFPKPEFFIEAVSCGFGTYEEWNKARLTGLTYEFELKFYDDMVKNNFPTMDEYFEAKSHNIANKHEWDEKVTSIVESGKNFDYRVFKNMFDYKFYFNYTLKSKFNYIFLVILLTSFIEYYIFIDGFYTNTNYLTILTYYYFVNRWIFYFAIFFIAYFVYFLLFKPPTIALEGKIVKINVFVYSLILLILTNFRPELFLLGPPQEFIGLDNRIVEGVMQPFLGFGIFIWIMFLPLVFFSIRSLNVVNTGEYYKILNGNFINFKDLEEFKSHGVMVSQDFLYELKHQPYMKNAPIITD